MTYLGESDEDGEKGKGGLIIMDDLPKWNHEDDLIVMGDLPR